MMNEDYDKIDIIFQSVIKRLRHENIAETAEKSGVAEKTLYSWLNGDVLIPSVGTLIPVGLVLGDCIEYGIRTAKGEREWITF